MYRAEGTHPGHKGHVLGKIFQTEDEAAAYAIERGLIDWRTVPASRARRVRGTYNPNVPCTASCKEATGYTCVCSCAGANHGRRTACTASPGPATA